MDALIKKLGTSAAVAVAFRYAIAIGGAVLTTAGIVTSDQWRDVVAVVPTVIGGVMTIAPVVIAIFRALVPRVKVADVPPEVRTEAVVKATKQRHERTIVERLLGK